FVDRPVKTYSSGMFVRLAFAEAIHMNPDVLVIDEALSVGDFFFQQRCIRRILEMKQRGVTIVFVSHDIESIRSIADRAIWMDHGRIHLEGDPRDVTAEYVATLLSRGKKEASPQEAAANVSPLSAELHMSEEALARIPALMDHLPNIDQRHGNGKARI